MEPSFVRANPLFVASWLFERTSTATLLGMKQRVMLTIASLLSILLSVTALFSVILSARGLWNQRTRSR